MTIDRVTWCVFAISYGFGLTNLFGWLAYGSVTELALCMVHLFFAIGLTCEALRKD